MIKSELRFSSRSLEMVLKLNFKLDVKESLRQTWGTKIFFENLLFIVIIKHKSKFLLIQD